MEAHVLNGDALLEKFSIAGEIIVCREALIDGPVMASDDKTFWEQRADFILGQYPSSPEEYIRLVVHEFDKLQNSTCQVVNLWFEHDLFCQINLWFTINFICRHRPNADLYIAMPDPLNDPQWSGFGMMTAQQLETCYKNRVRVTSRDKQLAIALWHAFQQNNRQELYRLAETKSNCFPKLREVCQSHLDRAPEKGLGRPQQKLLSILNSGKTDFHSVFAEFRTTEGVYGFGDLQIRKLLSELQ